MCDCIEQTSRSLCGTNTALFVPGILDMATGQVTYDKVCIVTTKRNPKSRERVSPIIATYCPFCGEKYEAQP